MAFDVWGALCSGSDAVLFGGVGLPFALFLAGLTGSAAHCAPMCGPFVIAQVADRLAAVPVRHLCALTRLRSGLLLPYHLGRITTYAGLGVAAAAIGTVAAGLPWFSALASVLLFLAALLFAGQALKRLVPRLGAIAPVPWFAPIARRAARLDRTHWSGSFMLGLLLGFLPCGLLYAALMASAASAAPALGAIAMIGFGLGTVPALVLVGVAGQVAGRRFGATTAIVGPAVMMINAITLAAIGWHRLMA